MSLLKVLVLAGAVVSLLMAVDAPSALADGQAIVNAAQAMENAGYPYCFDGGTINGPTVGITDSSSDGSYSNCSQIGKVGFDCTGLTLYAVYQGTGNAGLSHDGYQARSGGGQVISSESALQPGDVVYFDYNAGHGLSYIDHAGIYVGNGNVLSAVSEHYGIRTESISWYEAGGLHFVGAVRYWSGGAPSNGSFVQVSGSPAIYRIAGGAPLYVSSWSAVGGSQPYAVISQQQFNSLNAVPANGTFIRDAGSGAIWEIAGGAPLYVSSCANLAGCPGAINVDVWDVQNVGNPAAHLNPVPANAAFIRDPVSGAIWEVAGGAPLYVSSCANLGGCSGAVNIDPYAVGHLDHLNGVPWNGAFIRDPVSGAIWEVAGGAPLYVSSCANLGGCAGAVNIDPYAVGHLDHLSAVPANGTFLATTAGSVYRVAGGAPFLVSRWSVFGGTQPSVAIDQWDIANVSNPQAHLRPVPVDGTIVEGLPSGSFWAFAGGYRTQTGASPAAVGVDDVGLGTYPQVPPASIGSTSTGTPGNGSGATLGSAGSGGANGGGAGAGTPNSPTACIVPRLLSMTVTQARRALRAAGCRLGRIHRPKHTRSRHVFRVRGQSIRPGSKRTTNTAIEVTVK